MTEWADVAARAHGLSTHLLERRRLEELAVSPDLRALTRRLRTTGYETLEETSDPVTAERAIEREAARRGSLLARWLGERSERLAVLLDAPDLRAVRALLRAAAQGAAPEARLAGVPPPSRLPRPALEELARAPSPAAVAEGLRALGHPFGDLLVGDEPAVGGLLGLELRLARAWARRAVAGAREWELREFVGWAVDLANAWTALTACGDRDVDWNEAFLEGGASLGPEEFRDALAEREPPAALRRLARVFARGPLAPALRDPEPTVSAFELRALEALVAEQRRVTRVRPLGPAPVLHYLLRLELEVRALRGILWGRVLDAPPAVLIRELPRVA